MDELRLFRCLLLQRKTMDSMKAYQDVEVMLSSKWAAKLRPKAFRPAVVGDWVFLPTADQIVKLTADHVANLGVCHLILEPIAPDPKEWWPRWLKARWLFGGMSCVGEWGWCVSNAEEAPTPNPFAFKGSVVSWGYWDKSQISLPLGERMIRLSPSLLDLSFIPEVEPKDACFKNPWREEMGREVRRVPPNYQHPKVWRSYGRIGYQPMFDRDYYEAVDEYQTEFARWRVSECDNDCEDPVGEFEDYYGPHPNPEYYRHYRLEDATWYQLWETVSEGTPVTPPFETQQELVDYLVENGDFWDQERRKEGVASIHCGPWKREEAESLVFGSGWRPTITAYEVKKHMAEFGFCSPDAVADTPTVDRSKPSS